MRSSGLVYSSVELSSESTSLVNDSTMTRFTISWYPCLSSAILITSSNVIFILLKSLLMVCSHWRGCPPLIFFTGLRYASLKAFLAGASLGSLLKCPNHFSLFCLIVTDQGVVLHSLYRSSFFIRLVLTICLRNDLWKVSIFCLFWKLMVQSSELYRKIDETSASNTRILTARDISFEQRVCLFFEKAAHATCFCALYPRHFQVGLVKICNFSNLF